MAKDDLTAWYVIRGEEVPLWLHRNWTEGG